ncbi:carbon catabolite repressor protein [Canna indica]|uniref:Carbon catabolite repressor protein n=1 Tax=Canna indica TaxID=4628 RepID=A0AAQ3Q802_9LILI|nr:carbon catabolite repressor protein [Canna indica]
MRFASRRPPSVQSAGTCPAMSSPYRFKQVAGRSQWHRCYREAPPPPADSAAAATQEGSAPGPSFVSGDSHLRSVREANHDMRQWHRGGGAWRPRGAPHQSFSRWRPPPFSPPPPTHAQPAPSYGPPLPNYGQPAPSYGPPLPNYGQPAPSYGPPLPNYGQPAPSYGIPPPFYGPSPAVAHGSHVSHYGYHSPSHDPPPTLHFRPQSFRPSPPPRLTDYRSWSFCQSQPPPQSERFVVLSYNILADYLARDHRSKLYFHIPHYILDWEWRKRRLLLEFRLWAPDIMCLQEVDRFHDLEQELTTQGYAGIWKMRTGSAVDGCAILWRTNRFQLKYDEAIEFNKLGLRDNVAQICVFESRIESPVENESASFPNSSDQSRRTNLVVVCNIHVLYNPKRGEIKLGQVRTLLDRAHAVSRIWNNAPVIVCGDFNSTPKSPLYNFIAEQKLHLSGLARDQVSGQYSASLSSSRLYTGPGLSRAQPHMDEATKDSCKPQDKPENKHRTEDTLTESNDTLLSMPQAHPDSQMLYRTSIVPGEATSKIGEGETSNSESCSIDSSSVEIPTDTCSSCNQLSRSQGAASIVSSGDKSFVGVHSVVGRPMAEFSQSEQIMSNQSNDSSFQNNEPCELVADPSGDKNHSAVPRSEISTQRSQGSEVSLNDDFMTEVFSERVSATVTAVSEVSSESINSFPTDVAMEKEMTPVMVGQDTSEHKSSDSSNCDDSLENESKKSVSDVANLSAKFDSTVNLFSNHLENHNSVGAVGDVCNDISGSEENSDPNFFRELLGTDEICHFNESISDSCPNQLSASSCSLDPSSVESWEENAGGASSFTNTSEKWSYNPFLWTPMEIEVASGSTDCTLLEHSLKLRSVYTDVEDYAGTKGSSREPQVTSYNRQFMGTVDYIWSSEGLQTAKVLDTFPKHVLEKTSGFPTKRWGSDHVALACELAFVNGSSTE